MKAPRSPPKPPPQEQVQKGSAWAGTLRRSRLGRGETVAGTPGGPGALGLGEGPVVMGTVADGGGPRAAGSKPAGGATGSRSQECKGKKIKLKIYFDDHNSAVIFQSPLAAARRNQNQPHRTRQQPSK